MFKNKSIFLSIDLDYWESITPLSKYIKYLLKNCSAPIRIYHEHHHILNWANKNPCDLLINVDYHSDLADDTQKKTPPRLTCGTWGNHIIWRNKGKFIWLPPKMDNYTNKSGVCTLKDEADPFSTDSSGWNTHTKVVSHRNLYKIPLKQVKAVAICLSVDYCFWYDYANSKIKDKIQKILPIPDAWFNQLYRMSKNKFDPYQRSKNGKKFRLTKP